MDTLDRPADHAARLSDRAAEEFAARASEVAANIARIIKGKPEVIAQALVCFFAEGHLLVEDVPGVGKTQLARALAASVDASWNRVQFTPDLLPSDVTGVTIFRQETGGFEFHQGPVFANIVLADEINRASPRTQAAMLEVMEERQVTVDGAGHLVPRPFMVIATQNPIDMDGTYPLPEAQLDRFLMRTAVGYPDLQAELEILHNQNGSRPILSPVLSVADAAAMVGAVDRVYVGPEVSHYLVSLVAITRTFDDVRLPVSPRGTVGLLRASRARALTRGRPFVTPEDVKSLVVPVLEHRLVLTPEADLAGLTAAAVLERAVAAVPVPHAPMSSSRA
jgi:MoxR-like ATPase